MIKKMLILCFCFISTLGFAQTNTNVNYRKFTSSFTDKIQMPVELMKKCTATVCLVKIDVDSIKHIVSMQLSDSADSLLLNEFNKHKSDLDFKFFEQYLNDTYSKTQSKTFLIPLSYAMLSSVCGIQTINVSTLTRYNKFSGKYLTGEAVFLDPIYIFQAYQR